MTQEYAVLNDGTPAQVYFTYDDLGRLASKTFPVDGDLVTETYEYDIHGWPIRRRSRYFDQQLIYCDTTQNLPVTPRFSGNIAATKWRHEGQPAQAYVYDYDSRGQLTKARTYNDSVVSNRFAEFVQYHPNRAVKSLTRYDGYGICTDSLAFPDNERPGHLYDCKDGEPRQCAFEYDLTGNATYDAYNDLEVRYNFLNLPSSVRGRDFYTYLADGTKCAVIGDYDAGFDYIGSLLYLKTEEDTLLASAAFGSGRIVATDRSTIPHYYLCDHLGSTRVIVAATGVTETYDYYPYGLTWQQAEQPIGTNTYLFTGKEWQAQDGVNLYDFGARFYQSRFGKWLSFDPLAEEYMGISPFAYCANDPVNYIDPDGRKLYFAPGVSQEFKDKFAATINYMNARGTSGDIAKLHASEKTYYIGERNTDREMSKFNPAERTIYWNPNFGCQTDEGIWLSPATILAHEAGHAAQFDADPEQFSTDRRTVNAQYGNEEEKRNITTTEQFAAKKHGEIIDDMVTRKNHAAIGLVNVGRKGPDAQELFFKSRNEILFPDK